jgi:hypothetical protein
MSQDFPNHFLLERLGSYFTAETAGGDQPSRSAENQQSYLYLVSGLR